jgi:murein DD-endopeptidase MepM/ murein hydrolase activator NlpD
VQHRWKAHKGTDYAAKTRLRQSGTVIRTGYTGKRQLCKVKHNNTYSTQYYIKKILVRRGQHVKGCYW